MNRAGFMLVLATMWLSGCGLWPEATPILVYLPTATPTVTVTPVPTATLTPSPAPPPTPTGTATLTPQPWLGIELSVIDMETGSPVSGDVYVGLVVDDQRLDYLIEEDVSDLTFKLPRGVTRADVIIVRVVADDYLTGLARLPANVKELESVTLEVSMEKSPR